MAQRADQFAAVRTHALETQIGVLLAGTEIPSGFDAGELEAGFLHDRNDIAGCGGFFGRFSDPVRACLDHGEVGLGLGVPQVADQELGAAHDGAVIADHVVQIGL